MERLRGWMGHLSFDGLYLYAFVMAAVALSHAAVIERAEGHPLPWWAPLVMRAPLALLHATSHYQLVRMGRPRPDAFEAWSDRGALPAHEVRRLRWRDLRSLLAIVGLDMAVFVLAALACVWGPLATPETAWKEAFLWSFGPCAMFVCAIVLVVFVGAYERIRGR